MRRADAFATRRAAIRSRPQKFCANPAQSPGTSSTPALPQRRGNSRIFRLPNALVRYSRRKALASSQPPCVFPPTFLGKEWNYVEALKARGEVDRYGRPFAPEQRLLPPFCAVKVTGALFHTQGGLAIDAIGRVKRNDGTIFPNLFAAGGAAAGVSGTTAAGYLSGCLLTATVLGRFAGEAAAALVLR